MKIARVALICLVLAIPTGPLVGAPSEQSELTELTSSNSLDVDSYIDVNQILMFVSNAANFGRDLGGLFPYTVGTWWPYCGDTFFIANNIDGATLLSPLFQAGLWLGGIDSATGEIRVALSEYSSEHVPGPMENGTFLPDDPSFRIYKLYCDSLADNPSQDYLDWPVDQGAPVDGVGNPAMLGRQMLWSVCNDANPDAHTNDAGETEPLGVEVHQTVWGFWNPGVGTTSYPSRVIVDQLGTTDSRVAVYVLDYGQVMGHNYSVVIDSAGQYLPVWDLIDETLGTTILDNRPMNTKDTVDGLVISVTGETKLFNSFQVVANAAGVLDPPDAGAFWFNGFPVPTERDPAGYITYDQQVGEARWGIHNEDNGGTSGGGTNGTYEAFLANVTRDGENIEAINSYDYELRFTGSYDDPGEGGGYAVEWPEGTNAFWVPFEIWRTGRGTPNDPSDDVRLVPYIVDRWGEPEVWEGDDKFELESWGSSADGTCRGDCEHSASGDDNDPWTDRIYWNMPTDSTPGEAGYLANQDDMIAGVFDGSLVAYEILARTALVSLNGGVDPPFAMYCPENGTVFRILTEKTIPRDTFQFSTTRTELVEGDYEGASLYLRYKLYNKGENAIKNMYLALWTDPDLGGAGDDMVGCDTLNNLMFCYNADPQDSQYGNSIPTIGFKLLHGPVVPAPTETAIFDNQPLPDYRNLDMTAFNVYHGSLDPDDFEGAYGGMQCLNRVGDPYLYEGSVLAYRASGDPVTGIGDLDYPPEDKKMLLCSGPFDFSPGDSQYVLIKMSVARGPDYIQGVTAVKALLNEDFDPYTSDPGPAPPPLPSSFQVSHPYPNPFNPSTTIEYHLDQRERVIVDVYNILGQRVTRLRDQLQWAGDHEVVWDGTNSAGQRVGSGLYFCRVGAGKQAIAVKIMFLK
ncbi:MAG: T9SS type A sorting domain-containing protein [Candidatus Zixiibacteriota bacterium]|nr:MAG: T9SS type A sorting domain-containing protein [candidate division Zixibacteria bacterium]